MCLQRTQNPEAVRHALIDERLVKMRRALWEAKVAMYEAKHQAKRLDHDMSDRIANIFGCVENLFLEARSDAEKQLAAIEAALTVEYGASTVN